MWSSYFIHHHHHHHNTSILTNGTKNDSSLSSSSPSAFFRYTNRLLTNQCSHFFSHQARRCCLSMALVIGRKERHHPCSAIFPRPNRDPIASSPSVQSFFQLKHWFLPLDFLSFHFLSLPLDKRVDTLELSLPSIVACAHTHLRVLHVHFAHLSHGRAALWRISSSSLESIEQTFISVSFRYTG